MIESKEIPTGYISIQQIWLRAISDCRASIAHSAQTEHSTRYEGDVDERLIVDTVNALYSMLVDYGEARLLTDVTEWVNKKFNSRIQKIWSEYHDEKKKINSKEYHTHNDDEYLREVCSDCWKEHSILSIELFKFIIKTINKYGMLFPEQPKGYSNVEMKSL
jgi:hypothetical protein